MKQCDLFPQLNESQRAELVTQAEAIESAVMCKREDPFRHVRELLRDYERGLFDCEDLEIRTSPDRDGRLHLVVLATLIPPALSRR